MTKVQLTKEKINHHGGLSLVGKLIANFCGWPAVFKEPLSERSDSKNTGPSTKKPRSHAVA